jgi:hypothetical protein
VSHIKARNGSATLTRLEIAEGVTPGGNDGTTRDSQYLAISGGGYVTKFDPPYKLPANRRLCARLSTGVTDVRVN